MNVRARAYYCDRPPVTKFLPFNILHFLASAQRNQPYCALFFIANLSDKLPKLNHRQSRPRNLLKDFEMLVVCNNVFSISCYCTIHKLVVIRIGCNQPKMDIDFLIIGRAQPRYGLNDVTSNILCCFGCQNFFVLIQYFRIDTQLNITI